MNAFRLIGDLIHLLSIGLLLWKLRRSKSCVGISCKMQEIYLIVFCCRYVDLFWNFVSVYNTTMKIFFIGSTAFTIYMIRYKPPISQTYDSKADNFPYWYYCLIPCGFLSLMTCESYSPAEILWTFSIWLEACAILPQLTLLQRLREVENLTSNYVVALGLYRAFYILNWIYRYTTEGYINWVGWVGGVVQVLLYADFFYHYAVARWYGVKLILPYSQEA